MPAAAVIPAPIVYIKVAAVKKLVVGFRNVIGQRPSSGCVSIDTSYLLLNGVKLVYRSFTLKKLECSKQA